MTVATSVLLGLLMVFIWPPIQSALNTASHFMLEQNLTLSAFVFGVVERGLIPFGLHHIFILPSGLSSENI